MKSRFVLMMALPLMVSACTDTTQIQRIYTDVRDDCRGYAEGSIGQYAQGAQNERTYNAQLTSLFSDCMFEQGWTVAAPPKEGEGETVVAGNNPNDWGTSPQHPEILASSARSSAATTQPAARSAATVQEPVEPGHSATQGTAPAVVPAPITRQNMNQSNSEYRMNRQSLSRSATVYGNTRGSSASASRSSSAVVAGSRTSNRSSASVRGAARSSSTATRGSSYGTSRSSSSSSNLMNRTRSSR